MIDPPGAAELARLYDETVFSQPGNARYYTDERSNDAAARARVRWVERWRAGGRLLDFGCGFGHFVAALSAETWQACAADLSAAATAEARRRFAGPVHTGSAESLPVEWRGAFDVVTAWDVIEHVADPRGTMAALAACLRPDGWLFLSTPDAGAAVARLLGRRWHYLDPQQHLTLFSRAGLKRLCGAAGLQVEAERSFGRGYALDYLCYRVGYSFGGESWARAPRLGWLARWRVPVWLGDVVGIAAARATA